MPSKKVVFQLNVGKYAETLPKPSDIGKPTIKNLITYDPTKDNFEAYRGSQTMTFSEFAKSDYTDRIMQNEGVDVSLPSIQEITDPSQAKIPKQTPHEAAIINGISQSIPSTSDTVREAGDPKTIVKPKSFIDTIGESITNFFTKIFG